MLQELLWRSLFWTRQGQIGVLIGRRDIVHLTRILLSNGPVRSSSSRSSSGGNRSRSSSTSSTLARKLKVRPDQCLAGKASGLGLQLLMDQTLGWDTGAHTRTGSLHEVLRVNDGHYYKPARVDEKLAALDVHVGPTSSSSLPDDPASHRPAGCGRGVTAETVRRLCHDGNLSQAVEALGLLVQTDCCISKPLFYAVVKNCVGTKDLVLGRRVHAFTVEAGYESDTFLCNHILRMYASHGRLQDAMDVFGSVAQPDAFMWSSIISAHVRQGEAAEAIQLYQRMMCISSVKPDSHVFVAALQACARGADLTTGKQVHTHAVATGVGSDLFVCNGLVDMYAKCGSLEDAYRVFSGLDRKDVVTWNAMIAGYSQQGMGQEALQVYCAMQDQTIVAPNSMTFACLLQACASLGPLALEKGMRLHAEMVERKVQMDVVVDCSLVNMYVKCGTLQDAQCVFNSLSQKNVATWNAMIAGYSQKGMGQEAIHVYSAMQEEGKVAPDTVTFVCLFQACASVGAPALERGKQLHAKLGDQRLQVNMFLVNSLVNMYAKCGSLEDAQRVFDRLHQKNVATWNAMITGYSHKGMGQKALDLHSAMQQEGMVVPDSVSFVCLLHACASLGSSALDKGMQLHAQIEEEGLQRDMVVGCSLVNMYVKCGSLADAHIVFNGLSQKDVVTWNAVIAGYSQQGMGQEALCLYSAMQEEGIISPDAVTFVCLLQSCASMGTLALGQGKQLHAQIVERGLLADEVVGGSLVNMYAKCGSLESAETVFSRLQKKDAVTWTSLIAGYCQRGLGQEALSVYTAMQQEGVAAATSVTFVCLLQVCAILGFLALDKGRELHAHIEEQGLQADLTVGNNLINMYTKCGSLGDAQSVFDGLCRKDVVTWNVMIAGYSHLGMVEEALCLYSAMRNKGDDPPDSVTFSCLLQACASVGTTALEKGMQLHGQIEERGLEADVVVGCSLVSMYAKCGSLEDAQSVFDRLPERTVVTWNAIIAGYSQQGKCQEALRLYSIMQQESTVSPDCVTFVCILQACAGVAALHMGRKLHAEIKEQGLVSDVSVAISLINMYSKCGSMEDAQEVFDALLEKDIVAWNALIAGYTRLGDSELVISLIEKMREDGLQPDGITFLSVIAVCSHAGLVDKGQEYFEAMSRQYGITPTIEHYSCLVDLLGRAGQLNEALAVVRTMPVQPQAAVWHTLLGACRKWSNVEVASHAFHEAVKLNEKDSAAYVLMSNIYIGAQLWKEAQEMQVRRKGAGAWKQPGHSSWTDGDGLVHSFLVGDKKHSESDSIYSRLKQLVTEMRKQGYIPHLDSSWEISDDEDEAVLAEG